MHVLAFVHICARRRVIVICMGMQMTRQRCPDADADADAVLCDANALLALCASAFVAHSYTVSSCWCCDRNSCWMCGVCVFASAHNLTNANHDRIDRIGRGENLL